MGEPSIFFSEVNERQGVFTRRAFMMGGVAGIGLGVLSGRLAQLQLIKSEEYRAASAENQFDFRLVTPPRGLILDRNGVAIASNRGSFRVMLDKGKVKDLDGAIDTLAQLVPISEERRRQIKRDKSPVAVADDLTWEQFSAISIRAPELPGVTAEMGEMRVYPYPAFAHVVGYVAKANDKEIKAAGPDTEGLFHHPGFRIGKVGVEKALDTALRGKAGGQKIEVDARGRVVRQDPKGDRQAVAGKEVVLTLDADIQNRALEVFGEESGAAVMMDCRTGDLLCMASTPSFDANRFVRGVPGPEYAALAGYERKPLLDKALTGTFYPGSTFKPTTALALLSAGVDPRDRVVCTGGYFYGGRRFACWKKGGHGSQDMHDAIKNSCDTYFYAMCNRAGIDVINDTARKLGYETKFNIGIPGESKGFVPSTAWALRAPSRKGLKWQLGETLSVAIGQIVVANALQMAVACARIANGKKALNPRLIKSIGGVDMPLGADVPDLPFPAEHLAIVRGGMQAVANDPSGTAYRQSQLGLGDVKMAGKTGTAQVRSYDNVNRASAAVQWKLKDHNLFIAFAPYDAPRYALSIIVEHGGMGGATAGAPRAREIMRVALLKDPEIRERIVNPTPLPDAPVDEMEGADPGLPVDMAAPPTPAVPPQ